MYANPLEPAKAAQHALADALRLQAMRYSGTQVDERKNKPELTKRIEQTSGDLAALEEDFAYAHKIAPEIVAAAASNDFAVVDKRLGPQVLWANAIASSPKRGWGMVDSLFAFTMFLFFPFHQDIRRDPLQPSSHDRSPPYALVATRFPAMHLTSAALAAALPLACAQTSSPKRGLVFVPDPRWPEDAAIWTSQPGSPLTWYYNYEREPSTEFAGLPQEDFEFVPMLWGAPEDEDDASFRESVEAQIDAGRDIRHVLAFNEPDGPQGQSGGSAVDPATAARVWIRNFEPLAERGVKLGLPACTGGWGGIPWLQQFLGNCSELVSSGGEERNCTYDFVNIHWYGNFEGLASHMGSYSAAFPNITQWITEYNFDSQDLPSTQEFFNMSSEYFDRMDSVGRYSYFGSFRSEASNVGPNAVMLSNDGQLTDIGSWYLGGSATGVDPQSSAAAARLSPVSFVVAVVVGIVLRKWLH
ncbi:hypothetical protein DL769_000121 [Monosporascus sp. CRB-8-3]|nr:hypothetical protein DL769_000121 [Monosporascus sp. CRB-8-3]